VDFDTLRIEAPPTVTRDAFGVASTSPCFGIIGMLLPWKGHAVFLHAAQRVFERVPNARAFVVGAAPHGDKHYEGELRALAKDLGIADRVIFTGFRPDVPDVLKLLDVVVHASITPEPFGRVIAEAMAMRRPVIASSAGGPTEIIEDGRTGFLVPPRDHAAMADRVVALLTNPALAQKIAEAGFQEARDRFSADVHAQRVQRVYGMLLQTGKGRGRSRRPVDLASDPEVIHRES
jgi:glycosyltransferase involved in cell wall biosynthesis